MLTRCDCGRMGAAPSGLCDACRWGDDRPSQFFASNADGDTVEISGSGRPAKPTDRISAPSPADARSGDSGNAYIGAQVVRAVLISVAWIGIAAIVLGAFGRSVSYVGVYLVTAYVFLIAGMRIGRRDAEISGCAS